MQDGQKYLELKQKNVVTLHKRTEGVVLEQKLYSDETGEALPQSPHKIIVTEAPVQTRIDFLQEQIDGLNVLKADIKAKDQEAIEAP